jgi:hypothetical protein
MTHRRLALTLIIAMLAVVSVPAAAKDTVVESIWAAVPLTVDGVAQEWENATPIFDKASGAQYALKNDGKDLYIIMVLRGDIARSTIAYTGMKIFVAAGDKKAKYAGILFLQKQLSPDELIASLEKKGEVLTEERKAEIRKQKSYAVFLEEAIVPKNAAAAPTAEAKPEPALFRSIQKGQVAVYEFKIPLSRIGQPGEVQPGAAIRVGFEWGGMTKDIMKNVMADRAASGAVARQGASEMATGDQSGDGGGGGPDFSYNRDPRYKKHAFWIDVKLAVKGS